MNLRASVCHRQRVVTIGLLLFTFVAAFCASPANAAAHLMELTNVPFFDDVINPKHDRLTLVFFHTPWCTSCRQFYQSYKSIANAFGVKDVSDKIYVTRVDVNALPDIGRRYNIVKFPTFMLFGNFEGSPVEFKDYRDVDTIVEFVKKYMPKLDAFEPSMLAKVGGEL